MDTPTPDDVRARSALLTARFADPAGDESLQLLLDDDAPVISSLTGRSIGPAGTPGEEVPAYLQPIAKRVFALRAERTTINLPADVRANILNSQRLRSFTAGPYSESYFAPGEIQAAKVLDPDPTINELLWALATEEKRAEWEHLWGMPHAPAAAVQRFVPRRGRY